MFDFVNYTRPVANRLIKIYNNRKEGYSKFRWGRFVEKTVNLSAPVKKSNFTQFFWLSIKQNKKSKTASLTLNKKSFNISQKLWNCTQSWNTYVQNSWIWHIWDKHTLWWRRLCTEIKETRTSKFTRRAFDRRW